MSIEYKIKISMVMKLALTHQGVRLVAGDLFETFEEVGGNGLGFPISPKFGVIECYDIALCVESTTDIVGRDCLLALSSWLIAVVS